MKNKQIIKESLKQIKDLLNNVKNMTEEDFKKILDGMTKFHEYSLFNQMILSFQGCSQVAGYKKWQELGRNVKKGAKAVWILAPYLRKEKVKVKNEEGEEEEKEKEILRGFYSVPLFDISQTEGKDIERGMTTRAEISFSQVSKFAQKSGFTVKLIPMEIRQGGSISNHTIQLNSNLNEAENVGSLIYELAHGLLNHSNGKGKDVSRETREQQAETATYLVCQTLGVERKSVFYLRSWELSENILDDFKDIDRVTRAIVQGLREKGGDIR